MIAEDASEETKKTDRDESRGKKRRDESLIEIRLAHPPGEAPLSEASPSDAPLSEVSGPKSRPADTADAAKRSDSEPENDDPDGPEEAPLLWPASPANSKHGKKPASKKSAAASDGGNERIGDALKRTRLNAGRDLKDIAAELRIRMDHLTALEDSDYEKLPGTAYACGFLRSYAEYLGLNPEEATESFKREAKIGDRHIAPKLSLPEPAEDERFPARSVIMASLIMAAAVYFGWSSLQDRPEPVIDEVPPELAADLPAGPSDAVPAPDAGAAERAEPDEPAASAASAKTGPSAAGKTEAALAQSAEAPAPAASAAPVATGPRLSLLAESDVWVQLRGADGAIVFEDVLRAGDRFELAGAAGARLTTGNAGALSVSLDGARQKALGEFGTILRGHEIGGGAL